MEAAKNQLLSGERRVYEFFLCKVGETGGLYGINSSAQVPLLETGLRIRIEAYGQF